MRALISTLSFIWNHPLNRSDRLGAIGRYVRWQISARISPGPIGIRFVEDTLLLASPGMTGATGNYYCGLHELSDMGFVLHALRPGDLFLDVGANIGSYTVLAAGAAGARVIAVEPIPETCERLRKNVAVNGLADRVLLVNKGLAAREGELRFTATLDCVNHVAVDGESEHCIAVPVTTIDHLCRETIPSIIKIDVEGFEDQVLAGAAKTLSSPAVLAVVMETNRSGARYGKRDDALFAEMRRLGFVPCGYDAIERNIVTEATGLGNTIFIRNPHALLPRLKSAKKYRLINGEI